MIFFFSFDFIIIVVIILLLFIGAIFNSTLNLWIILNEHIYIVILVLVLRAIANIVILIKDAEKKRYINQKKQITKKRLAFEIIANISYIVAFAMFINNMASLSVEHPVITSICAFISLFSLGGSLLFGFHFGESDSELTDIAVTIILFLISLVVIISTITTSFFLKIFLLLISGILTVGYSFRD